MNTQEMLRILDSIARDRNIERSSLITDLERAMVTAARKYYSTLDPEEFVCTIDPMTGEIVLYRHGEPMELDPASFGRIAAQTFKQVMIQGFRDDERASLMDDFGRRLGTIVTGVAQRYDHGALIVQVDRAECVMLRSEQIPGEQFESGDRVRALVLDVKDLGNQVKVYLSRGHQDFIKRLFEVEVPEVAEKIIEIKAMAREAGFRTKLAVSSLDSKVDAVGACVGVRGSRIKNIVDELNGEKIDIVRWNESSQVLIANALKPAEVQEISLCFELGRATVVVRDDQLSLAIGKRGQNVRLAARLTGWDVDILTPEEFNKGLDIMSTTLTSIDGISEEMADQLAVLGMVSIFDIEEVGADVLETELEISSELAERVVEVAATRAKEVQAQQEIEKEEAEQRRREERDAAEQMLRGNAEGEMDPELAASAILGASSLPSDSGGEGEGGGAAAEGAESAGEEAGEQKDESPAQAPTAEDEARAADILGNG